MRISLRKGLVILVYTFGCAGKIWGFLFYFLKYKTFQRDWIFLLSYMIMFNRLYLELIYSWMAFPDCIRIHHFLNKRLRFWLQEIGLEILRVAPLFCSRMFTCLNHLISYRQNVYVYASFSRWLNIGMNWKKILSVSHSSSCGRYSSIYRSSDYFADRLRDVSVYI